ncbi:hypothetical protein [Crassaminicella indica]|uniref:FbpB family small basic protein n=1 Tax=Crassaminicella indica TaxID=2855394 RepID=A0ABX8REY7_9CLOT|nr:hypothetical protein [Crassaminicella indica]QXM06310.1 hypothetical protein KVH43_00250 [Crassaminicella indica]
MKKKHHRGFENNFILLKQIEEKERRQEFENIAANENIFNKKIKSTLDQIKN